jgi:hypothetical protein
MQIGCAVICAMFLAMLMLPDSSMSLLKWLQAASRAVLSCAFLFFGGHCYACAAGELQQLS